MMRGGKRGSRSRNNEGLGTSEDEAGNEFEVEVDSNENELERSGRSSKKLWRRALDVLMTNYETAGSSRFGRIYSFRPSIPNEKFVIHPDDWRHVLWTHFILIWAVYSSFFTPLEFGFFRGLPENLFLLDIAGQIAFLIDIIVRFFVVYRDTHSHAMVYDRSLIAKRYLKSRFTVDFLGCLPWDAIYKACGKKELVRYMLWIRLSRALRVTEFFEGLEKDIRINYLFTRIVKLLVVELYSTHTAACIFYYLATTMPASQEGYTWIGSLQMGDYRYSHFREIDLWKRYITSLYFAIVTMATVGYGEIHAVNVREMIFIMIYVSFDMILGAYLLGNMTALIVKGSKTERFRDRMTELIKYMNKNNLGKQIRNEVKNHLRLQYSHKYTEATVLQDIPNSIRTKIQQKLYEPHIKKVPLFKGCSPGFIKQIAIKVCEELFLPGEVIIEQEASVDQLYVFCYGKLEGLKIEDDKEEKFPIQLEYYSTLGEVQILSNTTLHYKIKASELCKLLRLDKQSFTDLLEIYFSDGRTILNNLLKGKESNFSKKIMESDISLYITNHETELAMRVNCAAYDGDLNRLKHLISAGADPRMTDYNGRSPLHIAASRGYEEITSFLIDMGVDIHNLDKFGSSPLLDAIKNGHDQVASILVKAGASLAIDDAGDFLCITVARRDVDLLKKLLVNGINPNVKNYDYRTPLHIAASEGLYSMARLLLEAGASVLSKDRWGNTSLDEAYLSGNNNLIKLLKDARLSKLSESDDYRHLQGHMPKRKCIVFPFRPSVPREVEGRHGIVIWVPQTIEELIKEVKEKLNITTGICILTENGAKITEVEMISDEQNLFLAEDEYSV